MEIVNINFIWKRLLPTTLSVTNLEMHLQADPAQLRFGICIALTFVLFVHCSWPMRLVCFAAQERHDALGDDAGLWVRFSCHVTTTIRQSCEFNLFR